MFGHGGHDGGVRICIDSAKQYAYSAKQYTYDRLDEIAVLLSRKYRTDVFRLRRFLSQSCHFVKGQDGVLPRMRAQSALPEFALVSQAAPFSPARRANSLC